MSFIEGGTNGSLDDTNEVAVVPAPVSGRRIVRSIIIHNSDTANIMLTIKLQDTGGNTSIIWKGTLEAGDTWALSDGDIIILDTDLKSIIAVLDDAVEATEPDYVTSYGDVA